MKITNKLKVSKARFKALFPNADHEIFFRDPVSDEELIDRFLTNKLWRLNNLYTIVNKQGERVPFVMNESQLLVYSYSLLHARIIILKSRQQGISTFWLLSFHDDAIFKEDLSAGLMAQGKDEAGTLLTRTKFAWNNLNGKIKELLGIAINKDNADEIAFNNNSTIFIRTSFRSATLQRLHISEYGKICNKFPERAKETKTGTLQAIAPGNTAVIESTAEGINDFKRMWDKDYGKDINNLGPKEFLCVFLSWLLDPDCTSSVDRVPTATQAKYFKSIEVETGVTLTKQQKNFWIDQYDELGEATYQEYPATPEEAFKAVRDGSYYDELFQKHVKKHHRVVENLYDKNIPVEVFMDLGMNDTFVLTFVQFWEGSWRIIHEYCNNGFGLAHYVDYMNDTPYIIDMVYGPHDLEVRELTSGKSRKDRLYELGVRNLVVLPKLPVNDGIELVRAMLPNLWIDKTCTYIIDCFQNYSKEWDEKREVWKDKPLHNEWSHGADNVRYIAMSHATGRVTTHSGRKKQYRQVVDGMAI